MKLINRVLITLLIAGPFCVKLEAKTISVLLNNETKTSLNTSGNIPDQLNENPFTSPSFKPYCKSVSFENIGNLPIKHFFPYIGTPPVLSLEALADTVSNEPNPLLTLLKIWNQSVAIDNTALLSDCHPLDLLNFKCVSSQVGYNQGFLKLCQALGIGIRRANIKGKENYEFEIDDTWNFIDIANKQIYFDLDNDKLTSSEEAIDDPFIVLRTKHGGRNSPFDFITNLKQAATLQTLEQESFSPVSIKSEKLAKRGYKFNLFPSEVLSFERVYPGIALNQCAIRHTLNLNAREAEKEFKYRSPFPILRIVNNSQTQLYLSDYDIELEPGASYQFSKDVFKLKMAFTEKPEGSLDFFGIAAWKLCPALKKGTNQLHLGTKNNPTQIRVQFDVDEQLEETQERRIIVANQSKAFDYVSPVFHLASITGNFEQLWWQIGLDDQFNFVASSLDQVEPFTNAIRLTTMSETFLNPDTTFYFRVKGCTNGEWCEWSETFAFKVLKPNGVQEVNFEEHKDGGYELNWQRYADKKDASIEYLIFGSNSLDFIPSIYFDKQINAFINGEIAEQELNDNLIGITHEHTFRVDGSLAYYRIIVRKDGQISVPSKLIRIYDYGLVQPRNVLQFVPDDLSLIKRVLIPSNYEWSDCALPSISASKRYKCKLNELQYVLQTAKSIKENKFEYEYPDVPNEVWDDVTPYLLPENHPAWSKLNRIFCKTRATQSPEHFKKAGFRRWRPGRFSRVCASAHHSFPQYFIKAYCDAEVGIIYDWTKWIHRIHGAETIRECIKKNELQSNFKVPQKWIYPLPKKPAPPKGNRFVRKNFVLVCENMRIEEHEKNEKLYKTKISRKLMDGLYIILQECGLYDSVYVFNMPFCKDGRIAIIDTEYHHRWPIPFDKLTAKFPKKLQNYWKRITFKGGKISDGINIPCPPRMDRRDVR